MHAIPLFSNLTQLQSILQGVYAHEVCYGSKYKALKHGTELLKEVEGLTCEEHTSPGRLETVQITAKPRPTTVQHKTEACDSKSPKLSRQTFTTLLEVIAAAIRALAYSVKSSMSSYLVAMVACGDEAGFMVALHCMRL